MEGYKVLIFGLLILSIGVNSEYHKKGVHHMKKEKVTHLHFYLHDIFSGNKPSGVLVAKPNKPIGANLPTPFGSVYVIDDPITEGPELTSKVIGNAQGTFVSTGQDIYSLVLSIDFMFTTGKFKGSSIIVFSRNPVPEKQREVAVVGGRGKFKLARGFIEVKTQYFNATTGDITLEYDATVYHY